jgi:hypothetical protein
MDRESRLDPEPELRVAISRNYNNPHDRPDPISVFKAIMLRLVGVVVEKEQYRRLQ